MGGLGPPYHQPTAANLKNTSPFRPPAAANISLASSVGPKRGPLNWAASGARAPLQPAHSRQSQKSVIVSAACGGPHLLCFMPGAQAGALELGSKWGAGPPTTSPQPPTFKNPSPFR